MKYVELKNHIAEGGQQVGYYFSGSDDFLKSWSLKMFRATLSNPDVNFTSIATDDEREIISALESFPMFDAKRYVVAECLPSDFSRLAAYVARPNPTSVLFVSDFLEPKSDKKKKELETLKKQLTEIDCSPLSPPMLGKWIANEAGKFGAAVTSSAANLLIEYCKSDLSRISSELTKLATYKSGGTVEESDITALVPPSVEYKIWELSSAISTGDCAKALMVADKLEEDRMEFVAIFGAVYKHFHNLFFVGCSSETDAMECLGLTPYNYERLQAESKKFGMRRLKKILSVLSEIDIASKSGKLDQSMATRVLISGIIK